MTLHTDPADDRIRALFSDRYAEARAKFLAAAARRGLAVHSEPHPLPGAEGEALAIDVVCDGPADAERLLITTSAVHGVEGHCGSAVQCGLLDAAPPRAAGTALLHVHAVNPHGFSFGRRVTHENVDLNRNFIDFSRPLPVNAGYAEVHERLLPAQWPPSDENEAQLAAYAARVGARAYQCAVSLGQYTHDDGLFYGGRAPTWSNAAFRRILRRFCAGARHIAWIDLHTGLGPYGVGERIFASPDDQAGAEDRARRWWGERVTSVQTGSSSSIPLTGPIQFALPDECPHATQTNICLEFGTLPSAQMHLALRADHWLHRHGAGAGADAAQRAAIRQAMRAAFYPDADDWKRAVWQQAHEATVQALGGLAGMDAPAAG